MSSLQAIQMWKQMVEAHHEQSERTQDKTSPEGDFWRPFISFFKGDPGRTDDPVLTQIKMAIRASTTILDVGGGAGRYALPLASISKRVTVVEPSSSMVEGLREGVVTAGLSNVRVIQTSWEGADVKPADLVVCAHVLYGISEIVPFLTKLHSHARERVFVVILVNAPQNHLGVLWERLHGEPRIKLPGLKELMYVLWSMGIFPDINMIDGRGPYIYETWTQAKEEIRRRLYVVPDTPKEVDLDTALIESLVPVSGGLMIRGTPARQLAVVSWDPT